MFIVLLTWSCITSSNRDGCPPAGEQDVDMSLAALQQQRVEATSEEMAIKTVDLLVFNGADVDTGNAVFMYSRYAWNRSGTTYRATLRIGANLDIYVAINVRTLIESGVLSEGMTWNEVREVLIMYSPDQIDISDNGLPMWGYKLDYTVADNANNNMGTIKLLRSVASADIQVTASNFTLVRGYIVNGADRGYLPFSLDNISTADSNGDFSALSPEVPAAMTTTTDWSYTVTDDSNAIVNRFYMFDNDAPDNDRSYTKVVLEGYWSGSSNTATTFYPLAFREAGTSNLLQVTRNNKYTLIITNVNGDGFGSLAEAKEAEDVNMDYDVIDWDENYDGEIIIDGTSFFAITSKTVTLYRPIGSSADVGFSTNVPLDNILMSYSESETGVSGTIDTHPRFTVEIVTVTEDDGSRYNAFRVTAKEEYGADDNPAVLYVTAGRIRFTLTMTQVDESPDDWDYGNNYDKEL